MRMASLLFNEKKEDKFQKAAILLENYWPFNTILGTSELFYNRLLQQDRKELSSAFREVFCPFSKNCR